MAPNGDPQQYYFGTVPQNPVWTSSVYFGTVPQNPVWTSSVITTGSTLDTTVWATTSPPYSSARSLETRLDAVLEELRRINHKYNLWDANFTGCEVLACKMLFAQLPKDAAQIGISPLENGKRNMFLFVKTYDKAEEQVVDVFATKYGGPAIQDVGDTLPSRWTAEFVYKSPTSAVKRLLKEGRPSKELFLKDAIALSSRYDISITKPTQLDLNQINPGDPGGRKFLDKFNKEVGFRTNLAQLLIDKDPLVAEKARAIAEIILQR